MDDILHKLHEKSQAELWDLLKEPCWSKDHAEVAFYMVEVLKGVKKIEHMEKVQEAMERAEEMGEEGMGHMLGREQNMHHYARRGGGRKMPMRFGYDEGEWEDMPWEDRKYQRPEWEKPYYPMSRDKEQDKEKEKHHDKIVATHFENKYKELLEEKWEKEKREKEKEQSSTRVPPPPPSPK